jgi:hypothetical protein
MKTRHTTLRGLGLAAVVGASLVLAGCGGTTSSGSLPSPTPPAPATSMPPTAMPAPTVRDRVCDGLTWPRPMPAVVGLVVDPLSNEVQPLACLDSVKMVGPDGRILTGTAGGGPTEDR